MDLLYPLTAILGESLGITIDKLNFRKNRIAAMHLLRLVFVGMGLSLATYIVLTGKTLPAFSLVAISLLMLLALVSFLSNVFDILSLKVDDLSLREPMVGFQPILAGFFGYLFFPDERQTGFLIAFSLSAIIVYFGTHRRKLKRLQKKGMLYLSIGIFFEALLPSIYQFTMDYVSPEYIAFFRVIGILILIYAFLPIKRYKKTLSKTTYGLGAGVIYALTTVASLYAIQALGVAQTMLLLLLSPALIYLIGYFILHEKVRKGEVASSAALAGIALTAVFI